MSHIKSLDDRPWWNTMGKAGAHSKYPLPHHSHHHYSPPNYSIKIISNVIKYGSHYSQQQQKSTVYLRVAEKKDFEIS